jgi:hypothetical protein
MTSSDMLELFYGSDVYHKEHNWFYMGGTRYPADDQYAYRSVDPRYYAGAYPIQQTRYMTPVSMYGFSWSSVLDLVHLGSLDDAIFVVFQESK